MTTMSPTEFDEEEDGTVPQMLISDFIKNVLAQMVRNGRPVRIGEIENDDDHGKLRFLLEDVNRTWWTIRIDLVGQLTPV